MSLHNILLVEDNPDDIELTLRAFRKAGLNAEIVVVHDGLEALNYLFCDGEYAEQRLEKQPAVILLDLKLPRIEGLEVLKRLRKDDRTKLIPVVVLTNSIETKDVYASYNLGANSYIRKPVDFNRFSDALLQVGTYWLNSNEPPPSRETSFNFVEQTIQQSISGFCNDVFCVLRGMNGIPQHSAC